MGSNYCDRAEFDNISKRLLVLAVLLLIAPAAAAYAADKPPENVMTPQVRLAPGGKGIEASGDHARGSYRLVCSEHGSACEPKECHDKDLSLTDVQCVAIGDDTLCERWCVR